MAKHTTEEKLVQDFKEMADFQLPQEIVRRDLANLRAQLEKGLKSESPARRNVWSNIMNNKITKYVSAAMIFVAVFISMQFLPTSELSAAELLTKVSKNMSRSKIVKSVTENYLAGQTKPANSEISIKDYTRKQCFLKYSKGYLHQLDYEKMIWSIYRPQDNTMIVKQLSGEWTDPGAQFEEYIEKLTQEGIRVQQTKTVQNGISMTIIEYDEILNNISVNPDTYLSKMKMGQTTVKTISTKLVINMDELFLSNGEISYYDPLGNLIVTKKSTSEPIDTAPKDIYEMGVPANVQIINKVPDQRVQQVRKQIEEHRHHFLANYVAIQLENDVNKDGSESLVEGMVIYCKGRKLRVDVFKRPYPWEKDSISEQLMSLVNDSTIRIQSYVSQDFRPRGIRIYDGLWQHLYEEQSGQMVLRKPHRRPDGDVYGDDDLDDFGWRLLWWLNEPEWMYEDDFSEENNLLAMELTVQATGRQLPKRLTLYVDPAKDYLFRRYSEEELVDASWQIDKNWLDEIENKERLTERVWNYDVVEYSQSSIGQWYPKTITIKGYSYSPLRKNSTKSNINRVSRIYLLEENPDLPDELFDPEILVPFEQKTPE